MNREKRFARSKSDNEANHTMEMPPGPWILEELFGRRNPDPSLKRQMRCLKKGALPIGFASRPHPNGPLIA